MLLNSFSALPGQIVPQIIIIIVVKTMVMAEEKIMGANPIPIDAALLQGNSGLLMIHAKDIKFTTILII